MKPQHTNAKHWIQQGIFDGLDSFAAFEERVNALAEEKDRGDVFEIFVEAYLATQSIAQSVQHWVVGRIPLELRTRYRLPNDGTGIDGIYLTHDGTHVAYQVKYRQKSHLTYAEVAPFLGITEAFADRVIFTNASSLSNVALQRTRWFSSEAFIDLPASTFNQMECWLKEQPLRIIRATPDPNYQTQALADIAAAFAEADRAHAVMACGTGKTLVALWAAEQANPQTVLVLVPSLTLLQQTLKEWSEHNHWESRFSYLCVCSDQTVDLRSDEIRFNASDVGFRVDTDPTVVRSFLTRQEDDVKVIFSTYQSSPVVGEGSKGLPAFDFAVLDEAHKTTGRAGTSFSYALHDKNIQIRKRLFLTATPRHFDIKHRDKDGDLIVQSMDDPAVYGKRAHTLSFRAAADKGIICPYKVLISVIDKQMVDDFSLQHGITLVAGDELAARWVAHLIALERAARRVDAKKIISFHSRISAALEFASNSPRGIAHYLREYRVDHVNGAQSAADRSEIIQAFARTEHAMLTNARCLTEGINIPAVDMVAFMDPRESRVDIAQAVGRAMRKPRGTTTKTLGYVLVPLFCGTDGAGIDEAIHSEGFDVVASVVNALQENDEELADIIRELRERRGAGLRFNPSRFSEKIHLIGPTVDYAQLTQSIAIEIADRIGATWDEWCGRLVQFQQREGHCFVPISFKTNDGSKLGTWVNNQRALSDSISAERRQRLDQLG
ncbi:MAG: DEAD/DEAH box helicase, partial [Acidobacteria bacterium]|nr:DEAD/DEAH box helicase [Acidobacteriota bacterium]